MNGSSRYQGRFAPSPTGPLHFGSLIAATGSFLEAKSHNGDWLLRIEDLDPPREQAGAADLILSMLETYGFEWDGPVLHQSRCSENYEAALSALKLSGLLYPCSCSRKEISDSALRGIDGPVYPGTCRNTRPASRLPNAWRVKVEALEISFTDAIQGLQKQRLKEQIGDFVLKRADGIYAYQLAAVVDDAAQAITHVVRGADLLVSTPRQIFLQKLLALPEPHYCHLPIAVNAHGEKLSKQTLAAPLDATHAVQTLWRALAFLGQQPPAELLQTSQREIWQWAHRNWRLDAVPRTRVQPVDD